MALGPFEQRQALFAAGRSPVRVARGRRAPRSRGRRDRRRDPLGADRRLFRQTGVAAAVGDCAPDRHAAALHLPRRVRPASRRDRLEAQAERRHPQAAKRHRRDPHQLRGSAGADRSRADRGRARRPERREMKTRRALLGWTVALAALGAASAFAAAIGTGRLSPRRLSGADAGNARRQARAHGRGRESLVVRPEGLVHRRSAARARPQGLPPGTVFQDKPHVSIASWGGRAAPRAGGGLCWSRAIAEGWSHKAIRTH